MCIDDHYLEMPCKSGTLKKPINLSKEQRIHCSNMSYELTDYKFSVLYSQPPLLVELLRTRRTNVINSGTVYM